MPGNDQEYYVARSVQERAKAAAASDARAARAHLKMAERYETWAANVRKN